MSKKDHIAWLYREVPELVRSRVLDEASAERLREYYGPESQHRRRSLGLVICAALGALLIGLGIILLLAHNWTELSRFQRTLLSFAPLALGQALAGWVWFQRRSSLAWCEGAATFLFLAIGASIALVGQTYHISGDLPRFILVWMLLGLPLVYLFRAVLPALLYLSGVTWWCVLGTHDNLPVLFFWLLAALPLPFWWQLVRAGQRRLAAAWLAWVLALSLALGLGFSVHNVFEDFWAPLYLGLFAAYFLLAGQWSAAPAVGRPFRVVGSWGTVALMLLLTIKDVWRELPDDSMLRVAKGAWHDSLLLTVLLLLVIALLIRTFIRGRWQDGLFGLAAPLVVLQLLAGPRLFPLGLNLLIGNLYLLLLGSLVLKDGLASGQLPRLNAGLGILSALIAVRFFDSQLPFTVRGLLFILIGCAFLAANLLVKRREVRA
ncbi:MAG: DUF2157 domain-containing protein [Syntrophotaleaceae bacterium]